MRIIMPTFERIEWMPPTINMLKKLSRAGHEVVCITIYPSEYLKKINLKNVTNIALYPKEISLQHKIAYIKGVSGILFRIDNVIKKFICMKLKSVIDKELEKGGYLWVVNEMTVLLAGVNFLKGKKYSFTCYELHEKNYKNRNIEYAAKNAHSVIVPEYCRAHIMQSRYCMDKTPIVMPNKSDIVLNDEKSLSKNAKIAIYKVREAKSEGKIILLYMGGIGIERPLEPILNAIKKDEKYVLALVGRESSYLYKLLDEYGDKIMYLGAFLPPEHLSVAKEADIGILNYVSLNQKQGLNALFCAPNKIYEYTGLGLPVIANDIPGLRFEIKMNACGEIVDFNDLESIKSALKNIEDNYEKYAESAKEYYASLNIDNILSDILSGFKN